MRMLKKMFAFVLTLSMLAGFEMPAFTVSAAETGAVIRVGSEAGCNFATINEALDAIKGGQYKMPESEAERIYINVDPGEYEEQVIFDNMKYITLRKTPEKDGEVLLTWYFCTGYTSANCDLNGKYDQNIDWSNPGTWYGYNDVDENGNVIANNEEDFTPYEVGQTLRKLTFEDGTVIGSDVPTISYYDKTGAVHKNVSTRVANLGLADVIATLCVQSNSTDITVEDLRILNSVTVTVTEGEKKGHITPQERYEYNKDVKKVLSSATPRRDNLAICDENTREEASTKVVKALQTSTPNKDKTNLIAALEGLTDLTAGESAYLVRSSSYNERGHAISINGDRSILKNVTARGNQDSVYISSGRIYFKDCNLIGGTDYIYGDATAVFDNCLLGAAGFSDKEYGATITAANHDIANPYGYLFYNCEFYNMRENIGLSVYGRPWRQNAQITFYNTLIDDTKTTGKSAAGINNSSGHGGWSDMSGAMKEDARFYEYGTKMRSGKDAGLSSRIKNNNGFGSVLDEWQILEFNPRNYFNNSYRSGSGEWDPMNFGETYLAKIDKEIASADINVPAGEETVMDLPTPQDNNIEFKWVSASNNAAVSSDGSKITVMRPAYGEAPITTTVTLYAKDKTTGFGDKKDIPVTIAATTDSTNVFNVPVTVTASTTAETNNDYTVTITKNGALIKQEVVTVPAGQTSVTKTIENIPASAQGIGYDVKIVSSSDEFSIVSPEDGVTTITGVSGKPVPLNIVAQKAVDETVKLDINYKSGAHAAYDLMEKAKAAGANSSIATSDIITVEYDLDVKSVASGADYIDLLATKPTSSSNTDGLASRFALYRIYAGWNQIDMADCLTGFSGTSNLDNQWLNIAGKFDNSTVSHISATINYKTKTISAAATGSGERQSVKEYTFANFPSNYQKGNLYFAVYPNKAADYTISNVAVSYKKVISDTPEPTALPTDSPTQPPVKDARIESAKAENGTTVVSLANISEGIVIAAKYDGDVMTDVKYAPVDGTEITIDGIEADKVMVWDSINSMQPICEAVNVQSQEEPTPPPTTAPIGDVVNVDLTKMSEVPVYSAEKGQGFVTKSDAIMPAKYMRTVGATDNIELSAEKGASVTESTGSYLHYTNGNEYNYGGLIYRIDTGKPGAYRIEVEASSSADDTWIAPTGMQASRLTGTNNWDNCGQVPRTVSAKWEGSKWSYYFATGENFIEIEVEPSKLATSSSPKTVGIKKITITPLENNAADNKPTIHILGDSTQKAYSFNETISSWGQTLKNYFDLSKVNVVNYSMGGRAMKSNYNEGRFDEVLLRGKVGDYVFIHSAHNDETASNDRYERGSSVGGTLAANNENYNRWLDMYMTAIKARGMTPVLVTPMPRTGGGKYTTETSEKPNGFNPDSPGNMRVKAASDSGVGLVELYAGAKKYINSLDVNEIFYIYNTYEAGESPAQNAANGTSGDGTHYREAIAKQWCRIMLQNIYDQANASTDQYKDKDIMQRLVSLMPLSVQEAAKTGNWSAVFPEMASDVSTVGIIPGATKQSKDNYYYRPNIEKALELGLLHKDSNNNFKPTQTITVGEFARGAERAFGLEPNSLTNYNKTYAELQAQTSAAASAAEEAVTAAAAEDMTELADGEVTITVIQPEGGTVTVYNESEFHTATTNIKSKITANSVLGDNDYYTFKAPSEIVNKTDSNGKFASNKDVTTDYIEIRNNGTKQPEYVAKADGILTLYLMFVDHKLITCENKTDGTSSTKYINDTTVAGTTKANTYNAVTFEVKAGKTYQVYTNGGTGRLFGIQYETTDYPQSTTSLAASANDTIRVVALPNDYYINGSIIADGKVIGSAKEATFVVTKNTTVTAEFIAEPELVEDTIVSSDAALTREVMGAILYDAYQKADKKIIDQYIAQNGGVPSPDDPNYDPNIKYEGTPYIPLTGWGVLTDKSSINSSLYQKLKKAYNLGLVRTEKGIARGSVSNGTAIEPKTEVTRAKAAKSLVFCFILTQPMSNESQLLPEGNLAANTVADIAAPNPNAPSLPRTE